MLNFMKWFKKQKLEDALSALYLIALLFACVTKIQSTSRVVNKRREGFSFSIPGENSFDPKDFRLATIGQNLSPKPNKAFGSTWVAQSRSSKQRPSKDCETASTASERSIKKSIRQRTVRIFKTLTRPVTDLKAIPNMNPPDINVNVKLPLALLDQRYKKTLDNYTLKDAKNEVSTALKIIKPEFDNGNSELSAMYEDVQKLMKGHSDIIKKIENTPQPQIFVEYQGDSLDYQNHKAKMKNLVKEIPADKKERKKKHRKLLLESNSNRNLLHLKTGLVGVKKNGDDVFLKKNRQKFNEIAKKAAKKYKCLAVELIEHHVDPKHTSEKAEELGLGMPSTIIASQANVVVQIKILNNLNEHLTDFSLKKDISNEEKANYRVGPATLSYTMREPLNPFEAGQPIIEPKPGSILIATEDPEMKNYFKQDERMRRRRQFNRRRRQFFEKKNKRVKLFL